MKDDKEIFNEVLSEFAKENGFSDGESFISYIDECLGYIRQREPQVLLSFLERQNAYLKEVLKESSREETKRQKQTK